MTTNCHENRGPARDASSSWIAPSPPSDGGEGRGENSPKPFAHWTPEPAPCFLLPPQVSKPASRRGKGGKGDKIYHLYHFQKDRLFTFATFFTSKISKKARFTTFTTFTIKFQNEPGIHGSLHRREGVCDPAVWILDLSEIPTRSALPPRLAAFYVMKSGQFRKTPIFTLLLPYFYPTFTLPSAWERPAVEV